MKRLPALSLFTAALYGIWLLLNDSLAPGQLLLGLVVTLIVFVATAAMVRSRARPHHLMRAIRLFFNVLIDVFRSNITVAHIILGSEERRKNSCAYPSNAQPKRSCGIGLHNYHGARHSLGGAFAGRRCPDHSCAGSSG